MQIWCPQWHRTRTHNVYSAEHWGHLCFMVSLSKCQARDKNSITFHCCVATIITHLKPAQLMECFITADSGSPVHYLVFADVMALPLLFSYLPSLTIGFCITGAARCDNPFSFLLCFKEIEMSLHFLIIAFWH